MEIEETSLSTDSIKLSHPLLAETVWFKQQTYEEAEVEFHKKKAGLIDSKHAEQTRNIEDKKMSHPLLSETIWFKQQTLEEAEAKFHRKESGSVEPHLVQETKKIEMEKPSYLHPLLSETVWFKQNFYEEAEANYYKEHSGIVKSSGSIDQSKKTKKEKVVAHSEEKKAVSKKAEAPSWCEKLENKLTTIETHSEKLENALSHLRQVQATTKGLMVQLSSALETCLNQVTKELSGNQSSIEVIQTLLPSLRSTTRNIKQSIAAKECKPYRSHTAFCQAMHDRLSALEEEINLLGHAGSGVDITHLEQNLPHLIANINNIRLDMDVVELKNSESKVTTLIAAMDNVLKSGGNQKNGPAKFQNHNGLCASNNSLSFESLDDLSSFSGECSDFSGDEDDEDIVHRESTNHATSVALNASTPTKKKSKAIKKKGGITYKELKGNSSRTGEGKRVESSSKKPKHVEGNNQPQRKKTKTFHNRTSKYSPSSSEVSPSSTFPFLSASGTSLLQGSSNASTASSLSSPSILYGAASPPTATQQLSPSLFTSATFPDYNQMNSAFLGLSQVNPGCHEQILRDMAQKLQQVHTATKQTLDLQQMLQETERLRQLALESQQQKLLQEQFRQRYQMLLNAFSQYQKIFTHQHQQQVHFPCQQQALNLPKSQSHSKPQPSARFSDFQKKQQQKALEKKTDSQGHQNGTKPKDTSRTRSQQKEFSQAVGHLPGAVKVNGQSKSKTKTLSVSHPCPSSQVVQVAALSPWLHTDQQKGGISSIVVLDNFNCLLLVDIINSCLKLYKFTVNHTPRKYDFKVVTTLTLPNPYYMAKLNAHEVIMTRNGCFLSIVQVSTKHLKAINSIETATQYYGVTFAGHNMVAAAAYDATKIDLLRIERQSSLNVITLITIPYGPELLATIPATKDIVYLDKHPDGRIYLKCVNLRGEQVFKLALGRSTVNVWNLSCINDTILCCNKHRNKLLLFSSSGKRVGSLSMPDETVNQPFALGFSNCGDLFLANDGAWETEGNHYVTTEVNVYAFLNDSV